MYLVTLHPGCWKGKNYSPVNSDTPPTRTPLVRVPSPFDRPSREQRSSRDTKYNSQNKSPVYCQTTNFAHTSKQAVKKTKSRWQKQNKGKRKEALFFGLTLPYKQTSYGTAKVHTLNLLECSEFNGLRGCLSCFFTCFFLVSVEIS